MMHVADIVTECPVRVPLRQIDLRNIYYPQINRVETSIKFFKIVLNNILDSDAINIHKFKKITNFNCENPEGIYYIII